MCGIFGIVAGRQSGLSSQQMRALTGRLFEYSQLRGGEASGIACFTDESISLIKEPISAREFIRTARYKGILEQYFFHPEERLTGMIGHSRMVTNGFETLAFNNQPTEKDGVVCVHNGIVVNDEAIWNKYPDLDRKYEVDTEIVVSLFRHFVSDGCSVSDAVNKTFKEIEGSTNVALIADDINGLVLATNNGSLYFSVSPDGNAFVFASESEILRTSIRKTGVGSVFGGQITHLMPGTAMMVGFDGLCIEKWAMEESVSTLQAPTIVSRRKVYFDDNVQERRDNLRRCTKCILPETMPFIEFGSDGECNYCKNFVPTKQKSLEEFLAPFSSLTRESGQPDCIVGFSGGRDSSYGLHYLKKELGLNPIAYTYDWGMITDLARRNQSRMCGKLGIEQILHSADIEKKRDNVRKNVMAWLKKPDLGTVPILMAGDKHFYYYINQLQRRFCSPVIFCENGKLERSHFKAGYAGVNEVRRHRTYDVSKLENLRLVFYYASSFLRNPAYINGSIIDSATGYFSAYLTDHSGYYYLYDYLNWDEDKIDDTLINDYGWETDPTSPSTWRIGDGTAAFYNYIYYTMAGLTENDTLRSNQIRYGLMSRDEALKRVAEENKPRYEVMKWYANTIGFNLTMAIKRINAANKIFL